MSARQHAGRAEGAEFATFNHGDDEVECEQSEEDRAEERPHTDDISDNKKMWRGRGIPIKRNEHEVKEWIDSQVGPQHNL